MERHRSERISEAIREELEEIISYEMSDPRIEIAGISEVNISPDGKKANVRLILAGEPAHQRRTLDALQHARAFLRRELAARLDLFHTPDLYFDAALPAELSARAEHLLKRVKRGRPKADANPEQGVADPGPAINLDPSKPRPKVVEINSRTAASDEDVVEDTDEKSPAE